MGLFSNDAAGYLGNLYFTMSADNTALNKAMKDTQAMISKQTDVMTSAIGKVEKGLKAFAGAWVVKQIEGFISDTLHAVDALQKFSEELGISIEKLAGFKFAAEKSNIPTQMFDQGMRKFADAMKLAQVEGTAMQELFIQMRVDAFAPLDKAFEQTVDTMSHWENGIEKLGVAQELFGTRNAKFINLINEGTAGLNAQAAKFADLFGVPLEEASKMADEFDDSLVDIKVALQGAALIFTKEFLPALTGNNESLAKNIAMLREWAVVLGQAGKVVVDGVKTIANGVLGAFRFTAMVIADLADTVLRAVDFVVNGWIRNINRLIAAVNFVSSKLPGGSKLEIGKISEIIDIKVLAESFGEQARELEGQLGKQFTKTAEVIKEGNKQVETAIKTNAVNTDQLKKDVAAREAFLASYASLKEKLTNEVAGATGIEGVSEAMKMQAEIDAASAQLVELEKLGNSKLAMTEDFEKKRYEIMRLYAEKQKQLQIAQTKFVLETGSKIFTDLATITEAFAGKQNAVYKAMFAASKAFAIAESTVKIFQGVAEAASLPWPANLAAMASVVAATANIVGSIQAVKMEFEGRATGGPVSAGQTYMVGEKGPELFTPAGNGAITPNDALGGKGTRVIINNYTDGSVQVNERDDGEDRVVEVMIRKVADKIAGDIRTGSGSVPKAMESTYKVKRG